MIQQLLCSALAYLYMIIGPRTWGQLLMTPRYHQDANTTLTLEVSNQPSPLINLIPPPGLNTTTSPYAIEGGPFYPPTSYPFPSLDLRRSLGSRYVAHISGNSPNGTGSVFGQRLLTSVPVTLHPRAWHMPIGPQHYRIQESAPETSILRRRRLSGGRRSIRPALHPLRAHCDDTPPRQRLVLLPAS